MRCPWDDPERRWQDSRLSPRTASWSAGSFTGRLRGHGNRPPPGEKAKTIGISRDWLGSRCQSPGPFRSLVPTWVRSGGAD